MVTSPLRRLLLLSVALGTLLVCAPAAFALPHDVDLLGDAGVNVRIDGEDVSGQTGRRVSPAGDFNNDGIDDVVVGSPNADPGGRADAGSAFVVFGRAGADPANVYVGSAAADERFMRIDGGVAGDHAGLAVGGAGDVNGDGISDVIVGAPDAAFGGRAKAGVAYVVYGSDGGDSGDVGDVDLGAEPETTESFMRIGGAAPADEAGTAAASAGDVNDDGGADVVVGAPLADPNGSRSGSTSLVYGANEPVTDLEDVDLGGDPARFRRIDGATAGDQAGIAASGAGDVNFDGVDDVVIGAPFADPFGRTSAGTVFIVLGTLGDADDVGLGVTDDTFTAVTGAAPGDELGSTVASAGDANGDTSNDVVAGAQLADPAGRTNAGSAFVVYGQPSPGAPADLDLGSNESEDTARHRRILGASPEDRAGFSVGRAGDFNGDGRTDIVVGAIQTDFHDRPDAGSAYVVYGLGVADASDLDLNTPEDTQRPYTRIDGAGEGDQAGRSVSAAGDFNADGSPDVLVGALRTDFNGRLDAGSAYVVGLDVDDDGVVDGSDNCIAVANADQQDANEDGTGDACSNDDDGDGVEDGDDAFPRDGGETTDTDDDGVGDNADRDDDGDSTPDGEDAFRLDPGETTDTDGDGIGNNADTDDDGDGIADGNDAFPLDAASSADNDGDGIGNGSDVDDDGDGVRDSQDAFPLNPREDTDTDRDGLGDNADADDDGDGTPDARDAFPLNPREQGDCDGDGIGNAADPANGCSSPPAIRPALLVKRSAPKVVRVKGGGLRLKSGLAVVCPAGGPVCRASLSFKTVRRSKTTGNLVSFFITRKGRASTITVQPGKSVNVRRLLTRAGAQMLRRRGKLRVTARAALRAGDGEAIVRRAKLRLRAPR